MKKIKLFKFLTIASLPIIVSSVPVIASLTSCNKKCSEHGFVFASDGQTKITLLSNTYNLIKPFFKSIEDLASLSKEMHIIKSANFPLRGKDVVLKDKYDTSTYEKHNIIFLEEDYNAFLDLFKINGKTLPRVKSRLYLSIPESYMIICSDEHDFVVYVFGGKNWNIDKDKKTITFDLVLKSVDPAKKDDNITEVVYWEANLGKFTLTNALK